MAGLHHEILDRGELQRLQDEFCAAAGVYAFCVDSDGKDMTDMSGDERDREKLLRQVPREKLLSLFRRVSESNLEDQAVEDTETDALKYAAVSIREEGETILTWLVYGVLSDAAAEEDRAFAQEFSLRTTQRQFIRALDLLREIGGHMVKDRLSAEHAREESLKSLGSKEKAEKLQRRAEALAKIVQELDAGAPVKEILREVLAVLGRLLEIDCAYFCSVTEQDAAHMDVVAEWCGAGAVSGFGQEQRQPRPAYLYREGPLVLLPSSGRDDYERELERRGVKALAALPIVLEGRVGMYACFEVRREERSWQVDEIKFLNDSMKLLQGILDKRLQKNALAKRCAALEEMLDNADCSIYVRSRESGALLFANSLLRNFFREELERDELGHIFESGIPQGQEEGSLEVCMAEQGCWYEVSYKNIAWTDDSPALVCFIRDATEKKIYQKRLERQAYIDSLTGLSNRMGFERDLAEYVEAAKKDGGEGAVLYLDLDDFRHINDSIGHPYGDILLKSIAHGLWNVPGIRDSCYRMGGDEFVIIVPPGQYGMLDKIVDGVKSVFARPWFLKEDDYYCTMSMGIVQYPTAGENVQELVRKADIAMYEAKRIGKNCVFVYDDNIGTAFGRRLDMEKNMRDAALDGYREFEVYYQPIIDIQENSSCIGAEALIRWNSAEMGFQSPADFIPLAEYLGLINPIGTYVLQQACEACKRWNDSGYPGYKVNVNLSVVQLLQPDILEIVANMLEQTGLNPHNLTLEVTEGLAIHDLDRMKKTLEQIRAMGVRIALDDFGTGYSSLAHIKELPFDVIKVDQSFVRDLERDAYAKAFLKMVADLADAIGVSICVEGVENEQQYEALRGMRVRMIQGYYFGKPMPAAAFEEKYAPKSEDVNDKASDRKSNTAKRKKTASNRKKRGRRS